MTKNKDIDQLIEIIKESNNIVFFGGAGVSVESNIPDFRSANGLYNEKTNENIPVEEILSGSFFNQYPKRFYEFYKSKMIYPNALPNACHIALAKLEEMKKVKAVITQNIDNLHTLAGSKNVLELHGSVFRNYCTKCHTFYDEKYILEASDIPYCNKCGGIVKPDVVLYEESLNMNTLYKAIDYISNCDVLIVGGTSLSVYPAASLIRYYQGNKLVFINKSVTNYDNIANIIIKRNIGEVFAELMERL